MALPLPLAASTSTPTTQGVESLPRDQFRGSSSHILTQTTRLQHQPTQPQLCLETSISTTCSPLVASCDRRSQVNEEKAIAEEEGEGKEAQVIRDPPSQMAHPERHPVSSPKTSGDNRRGQSPKEGSRYPSSYMFIALLKACAELKDLERGKRVHAEIANSGLLEKDAALGSTLVSMYAKCGLVAKAQEVFDSLPVRDTVTWNALITGYVHHGHGEQALTCFERMRCDGISPNAITFLCSLRACSITGAIQKGQEIHSEITQRGLLKRNLVLGNALVNMYAKCGWLKKAQDVFDNLPVRNVVSWSALIAGYTQHGYGEEALNCFDEMQSAGISPDAHTFVSSLKACGSTGNLKKGQELHVEVNRNGLLKIDVIVGTALVDMYTKCGSLAKAQKVFEELPVRNVVSWSALIAAYAHHGHGEEALSCYERMLLEGVSPNEATFMCSLKACGIIGAVDKGRDIHAAIARKGLERDALVGTALVDMYAKCGLLAKAQEVFKNISVRTVVSWNALISGYVQHGCCKEALDFSSHMLVEGHSPNAVTFVCILKACSSVRATDKGLQSHAEIACKGLQERDIFVGTALVDMYVKFGLLAEAQNCFDKLLVRDVVAWSALIAGYADHGYGQEALNYFNQMQFEGIFPDAVTYVSCLKACASIGATHKAHEIHAEISRKGLLDRDIALGNALVDMYVKCGFVEKAQEVFDQLPVRNVVCWSALIAGYGHLGEADKVFSIFDRMITEGVTPDLVTFVSVLNACSHTGLVDKGQMYFESMNKVYGISPTLGHYTCMIDLLSRAGQLDKALLMMKNMPFEANLLMWNTLLGACQKWGNVEVGREAFENAVRFDETDHVPYVCMANIFSDAGMQEDANRIEVMRMERQAWKKPGQCWWTDWNGITHSFGTGGHPHMQKIYLKLEELSLKATKEGSCPGSQWMLQGISGDPKKDMLCGHSERLAVAYALINTFEGTPIHIVKDMRLCGDCHFVISVVSKIEQRRILIRDANCFHIFEAGKCACGDSR